MNVDADDAVRERGFLPAGKVVFKVENGVGNAKISVGNARIKEMGISIFVEIPFNYLAVPAGFEPAFSP